MNAPPRPRTPIKPARRSIRLEGYDLHVHTTHSDGGCSPGEVVRAASNVGLTGLAITDHDTVSAVAIARLEAARLGVELIPGVELTAIKDGREIHLLGHLVRDDDPGLVEACSTLREGRARRIVEMVERLQGLGLGVDLDTLRSTFPRATLGRKHLADWLVKTGQVVGHRDAFARYLGDDGPACVEKPRLPWREAIDLIRGAGGVAGLAHPPYDLHSNDLRELVVAGLGAIEVGGSGIDARLGLRWRGWADEMGLAPIAGTDFHSADRPGRWVGAVTTPSVDFDRLRSKCSAASTTGQPPFI